jgi:CBS domain containing-hemolysin-like protein
LYEFSDCITLWGGFSMTKTALCSKKKKKKKKNFKKKKKKKKKKLFQASKRMLRKIYGVNEDS